MNIAEIKSFLKIDNLTPDTEKAITFFWHEVEKNSVKRHRAVPFSVSKPPFTLIGEDIKKHLKGCKNGYLFVATLGSSIDALIKKTQLISMHDAVLIDAVASSFLESYCDEICRDLAKSKNLTTRFSPGYGDFPLEYQQDFAHILRMQKEIGVSLTESFLMIPTKSVTAIIGITEEKQKCVLQGCEDCEQAPVCAFSRNRMDSE